MSLLSPPARSTNGPSSGGPPDAPASRAAVVVPVTLRVNGTPHALELDARTTVLDALREHLHLTGSKKGCDHGQCGACTVLVNGVRVNSCLTLAVMHDAASTGDAIVTVEGLPALAGLPAAALHPLQQAFVDHDALQCGYCTPGQLCSGVGALGEIADGVPSHAAADVAAAPAATDAELRERMSGNLCRCGCRCGAYPHIIAALRDVALGAVAAGNAA